MELGHVVWGLHTHAHRLVLLLSRLEPSAGGEMGGPPSGCRPVLLQQGPHMPCLPFSASWCPECIQPLHGCHGAYYIRESHDSSRRLEESEDEGESIGGNHPWVCHLTPSLPPISVPCLPWSAMLFVVPLLSQNAPCTNPENGLYFVDELFVP